MVIKNILKSICITLIVTCINAENNDYQCNEQINEVSNITNNKIIYEMDNNIINETFIIVTTDEFWFSRTIESDIFWMSIAYLPKCFYNIKNIDGMVDINCNLLNNKVDETADILLGFTRLIPSEFSFKEQYPERKIDESLRTFNDSFNLYFRGIGSVYQTSFEIIFESGKNRIHYNGYGINNYKNIIDISRVLLFSLAIYFLKDYLHYLQYLSFTIIFVINFIIKFYILNQ